MPIFFLLDLKMFNEFTHIQKKKKTKNTQNTHKNKTYMSKLTDNINKCLFNLIFLRKLV